MMVVHGGRSPFGRWLRVERILRTVCKMSSTFFSVIGKMQDYIVDFYALLERKSLEYVRLQNATLRTECSTRGLSILKA